MDGDKFNISKYARDHQSLFPGRSLKAITTKINITKKLNLSNNNKKKRKLAINNNDNGNKNHLKKRKLHDIKKNDNNQHNNNNNNNNKPNCIKKLTIKIGDTLITLEKGTNLDVLPRGFYSLNAWRGGVVTAIHNEYLIWIRYELLLSDKKTKYCQELIDPRNYKRIRLHKEMENYYWIKIDIKCNKCGKKGFRSEYRRDLHQRDCAPKGACFRCDISFYDYSKMKNHCEMHHNNGNNNNNDRKK